jgi:hypothetical protein
MLIEPPRGFGKEAETDELKQGGQKGKTEHQPKI